MILNLLCIGSASQIAIIPQIPTLIKGKMNDAQSAPPLTSAVICSPSQLSEAQQADDLKNIFFPAHQYIIESGVFLKAVNDSMGTELEIKERLIEEYDYNLELLKLAESEGASNTVKRIKRKLQIIKLKLQPLELPDSIDE